MDVQKFTIPVVTSRKYTTYRRATGTVWSAINREKPTSESILALWLQMSATVNSNVLCDFQRLRALLVMRWKVRRLLPCDVPWTHWCVYNLQSLYRFGSLSATCAFKTPDWVTCRACDESYHLKCLDPPLLYKPNSWRCGFCKVNNIKGVGEKEEREQKKEPKPLFEGEHDDDCYMCFNGGGKLN